MSYSINSVSTITECDALLTMAQKEKSDLDYRKITLNRDKTEALTNGPEVDQELSVISTEITALKAIFSTLPAGDTKDDYEDRIKRAELRKRALTRKEENYGLVAGITLELDIARVEKEMEEINTFITEVTAKRATL